MQDLGKVNNRYVRDLRALEVRRFFDMEEKIHVLFDMGGAGDFLGLSTGVLSLCRPDSGKFGGGAQRVSPSVLPKSSAVFGIAGSSGTVGIGTA